MDFIRSAMTKIKWDSRLIGIRGPRGVGKTTLLLQYIKQHLPVNKTVLYASLDNIWFAENQLTDLADQFVKRGGRYLFLDEVHKYPNWSQEIKNIYDDYSELRIVFTGSSLLEILNARADLSRRAVIYNIQGMSYREYLHLEHDIELPVYTLSELIAKADSISRMVNRKIKPLMHFDDYLKWGYYPFYKEGVEVYHSRLEEIINMTLEVELPLLRHTDPAYTRKFKQLLQIISESVPFIPNVTKLSERMGINRNTFIAYLNFLEEAHIIRNVYKDAKGITKMQKPDKVLLDNTNFQFALAPHNANQGNLRETFFANQVSFQNNLEFSEYGDFLVNGKWTLEIGGNNKIGKQIRNVPNSFVVPDDTEYATNGRIPLWMFGLLY
ncbi:MAG: AAA family ATPase [Bacteroidetes bacterium]|nr:AAA family ATPase [Bacteroidota bacterium]